MAIGAGWAEGAWVDAGWATGAWSDGGADVTAPILSSPTSSDLKVTTVDLGVTTDEGNGTLYWAIREGATPLSAAAIKAGTGAVSNGSQAVSTTGAQSLDDVGSLVSNTSYYADFVHTDAASNDSNVVSTAQFTTATASPPPAGDGAEGGHHAGWMGLLNNHF